MGADLFVVVAFGFILPKAVLEMPELGCINVHFSLLPLLRGAAPVQRALMEGHRRTGVTIMQLDEGMDTGPILAQLEVPIFDDDNAASLEERLAVSGAGLLLEVLGRVEKGEARPLPQDDSLATYAPKISAEDAHLDWSQPAEVLLNKVRGLTPRPGAWSMLNGKRLKIWTVAGAEGPTEPPGASAPGTINVTDGQLLVQTGSGYIALTQVQPEGKARMSGPEFTRGYRPATGDRIL